MLEVARRLPETIFLVAGEGPLHDITRRDAPENVLFLGWREDVEVVYAAADAVLLTSDNEGMPVSLVEAAMCGTPAVSTDVGSAREVVVGEVTTPDADALAAALTRVVGARLGPGRVGTRRSVSAWSGWCGRTPISTVTSPSAPDSLEHLV